MQIRINYTLSYTTMPPRRSYTDETEWCKGNAGKVFEAKRHNINYYKVKENGFLIHIYDALEV